MNTNLFNGNTPFCQAFFKRICGSRTGPADATAEIGACKAGKPGTARSGFHDSAPFTESLLVGLLAVRFGKRIEWDAANLRAKNCPEAGPVIRKTYRAGHGI